MANRILIVGGGLTGGLVQHFLSKALINCNVPNTVFDLWEIAPSLGGRMKSYQFQEGHQRYDLDLGAQYITRHFECEDILDELVERNLLSPFPGKIDGMNSDRFKTTNYINPNGLDRIIEFFTENSNRVLSKELSTLSYDDADKKWIATCASGSTSSYDGIVLTIPASKVLELQGNYRNYLPDLLLEKLATVQYSSRFALSLFFSKISRNSIPWTSQYVKGDDMIRYISIENKKRQIVTEDSQEDIRTILVHTSIPFYHRMKGKSDEEITHVILERLFLHLPCLQSAETLLESSNLYRWDLSQVVPSSQSLELDNIDGGRLSRNYPISGKDHSFLVTQSGPGESNLPFPFLGMAGDYFTESNFNGCAKSARDLVEKIVSQEDRNV